MTPFSANYVANLQSRLASIRARCLQYGHDHRIGGTQKQLLDEVVELTAGNGVAHLLDPELVDRVKTALQFGEAKRYLAVPIDVGDVRALLASIGAEP